MMSQSLMGHPRDLLRDLEWLIVLGVNDGNGRDKMCPIRHKRTSVRGKIEVDI
jgi:hypothetical protein